MNGLSQFLVSIFHCRGEKREQGCREAEEGRIKDLTNNILIFPVILSPSLSLLSTSLLFPATSSVAGYSLSKPFLIPPSFQFVSSYIFFSSSCFFVLCITSPPHPQQPFLAFLVHQSQRLRDSAPILWHSNPLHSHVKVNIISWRHKDGIIWWHVTFHRTFLPIHRCLQSLQFTHTLSSPLTFLYLITFLSHVYSSCISAQLCRGVLLLFIMLSPQLSYSFSVISAPSCQILHCWHLLLQLVNAHMWLFK